MKTPKIASIEDALYAVQALGPPPFEVRCDYWFATCTKGDDIPSEFEYLDYKGWCASIHINSWHCSRQPGHAGQHVAVGLHHVKEMWPNLVELREQLSTHEGRVEYILATPEIHDMLREKLINAIKSFKKVGYVNGDGWGLSLLEAKNACDEARKRMGIIEVY